ncbi:MAG: Unknown protein [uncultured Sulfurovum sp.]|uniref:Paraquat-inducible protein A n=1 Tax=uncultured Sulfurovum sp. TaxID=269237 RepID=A0A6S6S264_9BACT|nr:MAG: Unknown protein [uncultured Sulfurovum sp.]
MKIFNRILTLISILLLFPLAYFSMELIKLGKEAQSYKVDYAELHSVKYGMFNSDEWTRKITEVMDVKIESFNLNLNNREEVEGYVSTVIDTLIVETERIVKERNTAESGFFNSIFGSTKQMITDSIVDFKDLRKRVPEFTAAVMIEIEKPENQERAKKALREKLKEFMKNKFKTDTDMTKFNALLLKYDVSNAEECSPILDQHIKNSTEKMNTLMLRILVIATVIIILLVIKGVLDSIALFTFTATSASLLMTGVLLPMLDIEAKITKLYFIVLEQPVIFENQILFFKSKSIVDLLVLLLESGEVKMIFVGVLLVMFSIIFPLLKLVTSILYYYSLGIVSNNAVTRFFALYSTKWSMADVMVVSMFMGFLGLDGVVENELNRLQTGEDPVNIVTFNGTHLEVGFFLFLGFVLTSFVFAILVERSRKHKDEKKENQGEEKELVSKII